jgi:DNA-binding NarL/FixJ family response regulator
MSERLRLVIAEDNYLVREGTRRLLEDSGEVEVHHPLARAWSCRRRSVSRPPKPLRRLAPHDVLCVRNRPGCRLVRGPGS